MQVAKQKIVIFRSVFIYKARIRTREYQILSNFPPISQSSHHTLYRNKSSREMPIKIYDEATLEYNA
jgi:hypothetical protein